MFITNIFYDTIQIKKKKSLFSGARAQGLNQGLGPLSVQSPSPPDGSAGNGADLSPISAPAPSAP